MTRRRSLLNSGDKRKGPTSEVFAFCLLLACGFQIFELLLPKIPIFPWLRLGLSHIIILPFLLRFGVIPTVLLFAFRNWIAFIYGAQPITSFLISTAAGEVSLLTIGFLVRWSYQKKWMGLTGVSVLLAASFNCLQLLIVNLSIIRHAGFYFQLGPILIWSTVSGGLIAFIVYKIQNKIETVFEPFSTENKSGSPSVPGKGFSAAMGIALFAVIFFNDNLRFQTVLLGAALISQRRAGFALCLRSWPFFFYLAWLHLFHGEGTFIVKNWITREGLHLFLLYSAKLVNALILGVRLAGDLSRLPVPNRSSRYARGFFLALPALPGLFKLSLNLGKSFVPLLAGRKNWEDETERVLKGFKESLAPSARPLNERVSR